MTLYFGTFLYILLFLLCMSGTKSEPESKLYAVPKAKIVAYIPKGFSISIPDSPGLKLFAFHGNINSNLEFLDAGTISKDILQPVNGVWTFKDTTTKLKVGDVINYWLFVENDGVGYRQDLQKFIVKEFSDDGNTTEVVEDVIMEASKPKQSSSTILSGDIHHHHHYYNEDMSATCQTVNTSLELEKIINQLNVVLLQLQSLHDRTEPFKNKLDSLEEVINELLKNKNNGTKLILIGNKPPHDSNVYEDIRGVITNRLDLHDLSSSIKFAKLTNNGIVFEVKTSIEKHRILLRARERFNTDQRKIVEYNSCVEESKSDVPEIYFRTTNTEKNVDESDDRVLFV